MTTDWAKQIKDPLLREDLEKCFAGDPQDRFVSGFGPRSAYAWSAENTKQVVYADTNGHIIELFVFVGGQWSWADLTTITGAPLAPFASELVAGYDWPAGNTKQVVYADENHHIIELSVGVGGQPPWSWADLTTITGAPVAEPEGENIVGYAWSGENTKQVVYIGRDETLPVHDRLIELYAFVGGQWRWADLTIITGATLGL